MYNFMGIIFEAHAGVFHFFAFLHSFRKLVSDFGDFQPLYVRRDRHRESTIHMGGNPGGTRPPPPHDFEGGGHNIKCPPPPPRVWGCTIIH